ncbi:MAG: diaminopimelate decarboxylase [Deltaproteobacteria bacterium]|nr:diaminopimelate decarboxylase [Deltaproteobacteria bacterium]
MSFYRYEKNEAFFGDRSARDLIESFGSPLYLYDENLIRTRCRELKAICGHPNFRVYYSAKANSSVALLKIIRDEGLNVDAMSNGEIYLEKMAGYSADEILFVSNNVSKDDFRLVIKERIRVCLDSISQLRSYARLNPGSEVVLRLNLGAGAGHHQKVVTAGKVKFGVQTERLEEAFKIAREYDLDLMGFMSHIGSFFLKEKPYLDNVRQLLEVAEAYESIRYLDFGGGFGIPYDKSNHQPFPIKAFGESFSELIVAWMEKTGRSPVFAVEPGRYVVGEAGLCLTQVQSTKTNSNTRFIGTDLGFNILLRPEMYGAYHEIVNAHKREPQVTETVNIVGNICESGDYLAREREIPAISEGDILMVLDTGAYGYCMASNYNSMSRPAELLLKPDGSVIQIRKRESFGDLIQNQIF